MIQKKQERLVVAVAVGAVLISILTTLYVSGAFTGLVEEAPQSYNNITFTDAVITCKQRTRDEYSKILHNLTLDDHSSRFDHSENVYKIFFNAKMASNKSSTGVSDFFINCYVDGNRGLVSGYESFENQEVTTEVIRKNDGGLFGWPINK